MNIFVRIARSVVLTASGPCKHADFIVRMMASNVVRMILMTLVTPHQFAVAHTISLRSAWKPIDDAVCSCAFRSAGWQDTSRLLEKCVVKWGRELGVEWAQSRCKRRKKQTPFTVNIFIYLTSQKGKHLLPEDWDENLMDPPIGFQEQTHTKHLQVGKNRNTLWTLFGNEQKEDQDIGDKYKYIIRPSSEENIPRSIRKRKHVHLRRSKFVEGNVRVSKINLTLSVGAIMGFWYLCFLCGTPIGQAKNPGPNFHERSFGGNEDNANQLWIGCANPTQLLGKTECFEEWGSGIWTFAETSATEKAQISIRNKANQVGHKVIFGKPVAPHHVGTEMRGRAGGVAIASDYPIRKYVYPSPDFVHESTRFVDTIVQMGSSYAIYISSLYGMASNSCAIPQSFTNNLFLQATERALSFKGPAVICGDFNIPLLKLDGWEILEQAGWQDAAMADSNKFGRPPQATTNFGLRHSFILMNPAMTAAFHSCRTSAHFDFDSHPLLVAGFSMQTMKEPITKWVLPKSFDDFMFDTDQILKNAKDICHKRQCLFSNALDVGDTTQAARQFTLAFEETMKSSCVDCEGQKVSIPPGHFGRFEGKPFKSRNVAVPCIRPGRQGDFTPIMTQTNSSLRHHTRQQRRIQSLLSQIRAAKRNDTTAAWFACQNLWNSILCAHGFSKSFASWVVIHLGWFVPLQTPHEEYVEGLHEAFTAFHKREIQEHYMRQTAKNKLKVTQDISKGGAMAFRDVKDVPTPPLDAINWVASCKLARTTWKKGGKKVIQLSEAPDLDIAMPVDFQGQSRWITKIEGNYITLDRSVTLKDAENPCVTQKRSSSKCRDMHQQLISYWSSLWNRDNHIDNAHWDDAKSFITCLGDCPSCEFKPLSHDMWKQSLRGVKKSNGQGL